MDSVVYRSIEGSEWKIVLFIHDEHYGDVPCNRYSGFPHGDVGGVLSRIELGWVDRNHDLVISCCRFRSADEPIGVRLYGPIAFCRADVDDADCLGGSFVVRMGGAEAQFRRSEKKICRLCGISYPNVTGIGVLVVQAVGHRQHDLVPSRLGIGVVGVTGEGEAMFVDGSGMGCAAEEGYLVFGGEKGAEEGADGACAKDDDG